MAVLQERVEVGLRPRLEVEVRSVAGRPTGTPRRPELGQGADDERVQDGKAVPGSSGARHGAPPPVVVAERWPVRGAARGAPWTPRACPARGNRSSSATDDP